MTIADPKKARNKFNNWKKNNYKYFLRRFNAQQGVCPICKEHMVLGKGLTAAQARKHAGIIATFDHVVRLIDGGDAIDTTNMRVICHSCNLQKETTYAKT